MTPQPDTQLESSLTRILAMLRRIEDSILVLLLTTMIGVAAIQVVLRNFFDAGLYWGDSLVRVTVLWVALVGAMIASRHDSHIRIDLLSRLIKPEDQKWLVRLTRLFTCVVLGLFTWGSGQFVYYEYVDNAIAFGGVPAWICEIIMPIGGGVMAFRYLLLTFKS